MSRHIDWTREQHIIAFNIYNQLSFGKMHKGNPLVMHLAKLVGRTPSSAAMKLTNFARLDPSLQKRGIKGMSHGAKGEQAVWDEFAADPERLALESERLIAQRSGQRIEETAGIETDDIPSAGEEREAIVKLRVKQGFFRRRVISAFDGECCVTRISHPELLVASHIIPWAEDAANRLNPRNGLCLNRLHDAAFDRHLMWVDEDFIIHLSPRLVKESKKPKETLDWMMSFDREPLHLPKKFTPDPVLLRRHAARCRS